MRYFFIDSIERPNGIATENENANEAIHEEITPEAKLRNDYQAYYKGVTVTQYANGIDHLEPEDLVGEEEDLSSKLCLDLWIINGIVTKGCTTDWREDQRPWCSLDAIFQGKFIFCPETEEERTLRENKLKAKTLFQEGIGEMNGWDIRKSIIRGGYDKAVESLNLGFEEASGFIAFFKLMGYFVPLNVKEAKQLAEDGAAKGQPVDQDVIAFMHALGVGYEANQAKAILNWTFGALGYVIIAYFCDTFFRSILLVLNLRYQEFCINGIRWISFGKYGAWISLFQRNYCCEELS